MTYTTNYDNPKEARDISYCREVQTIYIRTSD